MDLHMCSNHAYRIVTTGHGEAKYFATICLISMARLEIKFYVELYSYMLKWYIC